MFGQVATDIKTFRGKTFQAAQLTPAKYFFDVSTPELSQSCKKVQKIQLSMSKKSEFF